MSRLEDFWDGLTAVLSLPWLAFRIVHPARHPWNRIEETTT